MFDLALIVFGYLVGSVSSAILVCRAFGLEDPRTGGSHNPGATNVLRIGGKLPAAVTLAGDWAKGTVPVLVALWLGDNTAVVAATGLAAFFGHLYPVFFRFQGGKGVATGLGVLLAWSPSVLGLAALTWIVIAGAFRYSSLAAMVAFAMSPAYVFWLLGDPVITAATALMAAAVIWRHRANIVRLATGDEARIGDPMP